MCALLYKVWEREQLLWKCSRLVDRPSPRANQTQIPLKRSSKYCGLFQNCINFKPQTPRPNVCHTTNLSSTPYLTPASYRKADICSEEDDTAHGHTLFQYVDGTTSHQMSDWDEWTKTTTQEKNLTSGAAWMNQASLVLTLFFYAFWKLKPSP